MSSYDEMMKFVSRVKEEASHVDWLINKGISTYAKYEDYTFNEWTKMNTNLSVPVFLRKPSPHYERRRQNTQDSRLIPSLVYGVTKSAIHFLTN